MRYASRRLRQRLTWLVEFMRLWFSGEELTQLAHSRAVEHANGRLCSGDQLEYSRALGRALPDGHAERYRLDWEVFGSLPANQIGRSEEAESAYLEARKRDPSDPYPAINLARLLAATGSQAEARAAYCEAATLADAADSRVLASVDPNSQVLGSAHLLLQSHLWLGNRDLARQALERLAEAAAAGDRDAFARLKEQTQECQGIGLGPALRDLMTEGAWVDFLQPFALALGAAVAADPADALAGAPPELRTLAEEVLADLRPPSTAPAGRR
ncbi:hypothetical protein [Candidatus Thiodictyon syntrophicum]|jgi:hypothetical protein|uniref:Tetratricopeptide repeat protein n=1 Tax=Candidatus Thiodictyon syntrophicum TaxID=1166950 RepID=A0A2K8UBS4_9GAMM|nr:hypothetical protein [Candidatus Thiodictyon syntrophicum]AUB82879.1 hypothetical protein THSYN_19320 [Candidatus Thiodictyon syntrophicum]